ncbi:Uncharacterised protein [Raoultella terrigena]|uniref:Uncharacterized protein n=1 Tax=Raoultella terrigena TaxID=577 RepID=A0A3P8M0R2_RAOTE|nr:Uncharacterised protein [Raoultella terrigena]
MSHKYKGNIRAESTIYYNVLVFNMSFWLVR